jgi:hypothetical protein
MAYDNASRQPGRDETDTPHALQRVEHEHSDVLQEKLQQREHEHQDVLKQQLQRREHEHQHALLDRQEPAADPFSTQLALVAILGAIVLNGGALLLDLGHAPPAKMAPFAAGLVAGFLPTALAWTVTHQKRSPGARALRYGARLLWILSIVLFAIGGVFAAA